MTDTENLNAHSLIFYHHVDFQSPLPSNDFATPSTIGTCFKTYSKIIPAPTSIALVMYAAILRTPKSKAGTPRTTPAPLLDEEELPELEPVPEPEPEPPVAVGAFVIEPVPAAPAWLTTALQLDASLGLTFDAAPPKSHGLVF